MDQAQETDRELHDFISVHNGTFEWVNYGKMVALIWYDEVLGRCKTAYHTKWRDAVHAAIVQSLKG